MIRFVGVLRGVAIRRVIATERRAALLARSEMDPRAADLHTFVALPALCMRDRGDSREMGARRIGHDKTIPRAVHSRPSAIDESADAIREPSRLRESGAGAEFN